MTILEMLERWLAEGGTDIGEIRITATAAGFLLNHHADTALPGLEIFTRSEDARDIAKYDAEGRYRPLKTAPNLRRGWQLQMTDTAALRASLDYFYPAMLGTWLAHREQRLEPVPFREAAARQSGMYAVVKKITDAQASVLVGDFCKTEGGCLKRILWPLTADTSLDSLPREKFDPAPRAHELPLLCNEPCNLLIAAAREVVKADRPETPPAL